MASLVVKPVHSWSDRRKFLYYPWELYQGDPNWIPPLRMDQKELVGYARHPFYRTAASKTFLATRGGKVQGRLAAIINHAHNERYHEHLGFFGFFECVDDQEVADGLFEAAREWFAQHDIDHMRGPVNPSLNYSCGLLVDGFDTPPTFMMTYNPPYYERLLQNQGFSKIQDLYAFEGHVDMLKTLDDKLEFIVKSATERFSIHTRPMNTKQFMSEVKMFLEVYNKSLVGTWGFVPISDEEIRHLANGLRWLIVPELAIVGEVEGKPIGATFCLLDYNPRIKEINGRLFPFGLFKLLRNKQNIKRFRLISTNVIPEYQRWGVGLVLLSALAPTVLKTGIEEAEFSWVLESNALSRGSLEKGGALLTKTYRIYDCKSSNG